MKKIILGLTLALGIGAVAQASTGGIAWDKAPGKLDDTASLQNGAKLFVNYCLNCHSAAFMRFNRLQDIGLTDQEIKDNLLFTTDKVGEMMKAAIDPKEAKAWFGANPPDLTVIARSRSGAGGTAPTTSTPVAHLLPRRHRPTGWNNLAFPTSACRMRCGSCRASASRSTNERVARPGGAHLQRAGSRSRPADDAAAVRPGRGDLVNFLQVDGRAGPDQARADRGVGAAVPGLVHPDRLAPECGVLERRQVTRSSGPRASGLFLRSGVRLGDGGLPLLVFRS
jgi:ubiquinol-cytochrome c reductase cytochrome c1 subunit